MINRALFSSANGCWKTPPDLYAALDAEFHFDDDPCPEAGIFGLDRSWGKSSYVNPPYSNIREWMEKGLAEYRLGKIVVFLIPARTDTKWFHEIVLPFALEIRFVKGRLKFQGAKYNAPFPSMIVIFKGRPTKGD
jgi:site-specific DNA-methyltransferase (adenine-specific)